MGFFDFWRNMTGRERRRMDSNTAWALIRGMVGARTASGMVVTPDTALQSTAVFGCVRILAESIASLPLVVYRRTPAGKERATDFSLYGLLHDLPNPEMTSFEMIEVMMGGLLLWGNAYCYLEMDAGGRVVEIWPLRPDRMTARREMDGELLYYYRLPDRTPGPKTAVLRPDQVWHVRSFGLDGQMGISIIGMARQAIGLALATEEFGARFFSNDARPGIVLQHPGTMTDAAYTRLKESWSETYQGLSNAHKAAILEEGVRVEKIGIPPEEAQFLETRKFQVTEIARIFRVPPHMLADLERATFSNIEHQSIEFVTHSLRPWIVRIEKSILRCLLLPNERAQYFARFSVDALLRGDIKARYDAYAVGRMYGWLSLNDILDMEDRNTIGPEGDMRLSPLNLVPLEQMRNGLRAASTDPREERRLLAGGVEERKARAVAARRRLAATYQRVISDTAGRLVKREAQDIHRQAKKLLGGRSLERFRDWLGEYYGRDHRPVVERQMLPVMLAYGELAAGEAANEVAGEAPPVENFIRSYVEGYTGRHCGWAQGRIEARIRQAQADGEDVLTAVEDEVDAWQDGRAGEIGGEESVRLGNAVARAVFAGLGVMALRWYTFGDPCDFCQQMDGQVVGIDGAFLEAGGAVGPDDHRLTVGHSIGHPPLHGGCQCMIGAG